MIGEAEKHDVIKKPPPPPRGGVLVVPKELPLEVQRKIFDWQPENGKRDPIIRMTRIIWDFFKSQKEKDEKSDE